MYTTPFASHRTAGKLNCLLTGFALLLAACDPGPVPESPDTGRGALTVLTLNLHTYQELRSEGVTESDLTDRLAQERIESYGPLFDRIAAAINDLDADIVCFQEVGEWPAGDRDDPDSVHYGASDSNMVHQVRRRLDEPYFVQYTRLLEWAAELAVQGETTILCGDFNVPAKSPMQTFMTDGTGYADQYALANPDGTLDVTVGAAADGWESSDSGQRVDYILMNDDSPLEVVEARIVFTEEMYGVVSDHAGIYAQFDRRSDTSARE